MRRRTRKILVGTAIGLPVAFLIASIVIPTLNKSREEAGFNTNIRNMHQIGLGILLYCNDHHGQFPDSLATLIAKGPLTPKVLVDPASDDTPAEGATGDEIVRNIAKGGHQTYIYLGAGMTDKTATAEVLVAYEPLNIYKDGTNALFGDGHSEWITPANLKQLLSRPATSLTTAP